ncbi:hypothetical protein DFH07DRAFT_774609 [Mycena maculata]|uniref:Uncharacterized protein n=1 Tax=Mycena maculata TaxID=230809 RepID=A0AAD7IZU1_9AGAR|nr:hypothetical protein DFH07DRAFT_774609 [Mycena maculata]
MDNHGKLPEGPIGSERNQRCSHGNELRGWKRSNGWPTDPLWKRARGSGGMRTNPRKACKRTNVTGSVGTSPESPRKKTSQLGGTEQIEEHDDGDGKVAVPEVPEMEGNGIVNMPENAEGGNERNGNAEMTNGPGSPESRKEGVAMMGLVIIWNEA